MIHRFLAGQYSRPSGLVGEWLIGPALDRTGRQMSRIALGQLAPRAGAQVLEVGFGGGILTGSLIEAGAEVIGVDISAAMVKRARRRFRRPIAAGQACFVKTSAASLPFEAARFDHAVAVNVLYFWRDLSPVLGELYRVIRPGGSMVLGFQTPGAVQRWPGHRYGFTAHEPAAVIRAMERVGFRLEGSIEGHDRRVGDYVSVKGSRT